MMAIVDTFVCVDKEECDAERTRSRQAFMKLSLILAPVKNRSAYLVTSSGSPTMPPVIVIGFVRHDDMVHSGVQLTGRVGPFD